MKVPVDEAYGVIRITRQEPGNLMKRLDSVVRSAELTAIREGKHGVLVTRHPDFSFSVAVSEDVPYGMTQERDS
jgi:hypothetical protein